MDKNPVGERPRWYSGEFTADRMREMPMRALFEAIVYVGDQLKLLRDDMKIRAQGRKPR